MMTKQQKATIELLRKEGIIYIYGLTFDLRGEEHPWTELYTAEERARFEAALG